LEVGEVKTAEQRIKTEHEWHHRWLNETGPGLLAEAEADLRGDLTEGTLSAVRKSKLTLSHFVAYYGIRGSARLVDRDPAAWDDIYLSTAFRLEYLRLRYALWTKVADEPGLDFEVPKIACTLCFCLANGFTHWAAFLGGMLVRAESDNEMVSGTYWRKRIFEPFACRLAEYAATAGSSRPLAVKPLGVYAEIFDSWESPEKLSQAIGAICDYHCQRMEDHGQWDAEFDDPPCDLVAWEVLAIREVRRRMGLAIVEPPHPLLALVGTFIPRKELPFDERLNAIEELARSQYMTVELP
jgi:hypothetical protein